MIKFLEIGKDETIDQYLERIRIQKERIANGEDGVTLQEQAELMALKNCKINPDLLKDYLEKNKGIKPIVNLLLEFINFAGVDENEFNERKQAIYEMEERNFSNWTTYYTNLREGYLSNDLMKAQLDKEEALEELYGTPAKNAKIMKPDPRRGKYSKGYKNN